MGTYNNEIEQFIYTVCYRPMWEAAYSYISEHPYALNLSYSRIQNPDAAMLEDMILEFTKNIRIDEDSLLFDAVVSCTITLTEETYNKTCWEVIFEILQSRGISKSHFCSLTGLGEEVYRKAEKNIDTKPSLRTIVAIGRGLDLDIGTTEKLLQLAGHAFDESDEQQALKYCITGFSGMSIDDANEFLESYNYEPLGTKQRL